MTIGKQIKAARAARRFTQEELAALSGVAASLICRYETDKLSPSLKTVAKLAKALRVAPGALLGAA